MKDCEIVPLRGRDDTCADRAVSTQKSRRQSRFKQIDISRAIRGVRDGGGEVSEFVILPTGELRVILGGKPSNPDDSAKQELDRFFAKKGPLHVAA